MFDLAETVDSVPAAQRIATALALVHAAVDTDPADLGDAALSEQLLACAELVERSQALTVLNAGVWEPRKIWCGGIARSARSWLSQHSTMGSAAAGVTLRCGRLVNTHEMVAKHLRTGELCCRKVELITQVATAERAELFTRDEHVLVNHIVALDADTAATLLRRWQLLCDDALADHDNASQRQRRRFHHSRAANTWHTNGQFDVEDGAIIDAALRDAMGSPDPADRPGGARSTEQRRADALALIARAWLADRNRPHGNQPVATVHMHIDEASLFGDDRSGFDPSAVCDLIPGGPISRGAAQRLLCDSYVGRIVIDAKGDVIDQGRLKRLFTAAQKRAMIARDGPHCVVPRCAIGVEHCQAHHLHPFETGGPTDILNGGHTCTGHHHDIHERGFTLARGPNHSWIFTAPDGTTWTS